MTEQDRWAEIEDTEADWIPGPPTEGEIEAARQERAVLDVDDELEATHQREREAGLSDAQIAELDGPPKLDSFRNAMARTQLTDVDAEGNESERYPDLLPEPDQQQQGAKAALSDAETQAGGRDLQLYHATLKNSVAGTVLNEAREALLNASLDPDEELEALFALVERSAEYAAIENPEYAPTIETAKVFGARYLADQYQSQAPGMTRAQAMERATADVERYALRVKYQAALNGEDVVTALHRESVARLQELGNLSTQGRKSQAERDAETVQAGQRAASRTLGRSGSRATAPVPRTEADIFRIKDPEEFDKAFAAWVEDQTG